MRTCYRWKRDWIGYLADTRSMKHERGLSIQSQIDLRSKQTWSNKPDSGVRRYSHNKPSDQAYSNLKFTYNRTDSSNAQHVTIKIDRFTDMNLNRLSWQR
jgi:hypothetical protein